MTNNGNGEARRGCELMVEVLRSEGVQYVFGNPGTTELPLIDALANAPDLTYVLGLHEATVVAMAEGYARASGRPGFVNLHTAGGLGQAMGMILSAQIAHTPLVVTTGQQDTRHGFTDPILSGDVVGIARPTVKWAHEVQHPEQIPTLVRRAFHDSTAAPAGPVLLSLPIDVMERTTAVAPGTASRIDSTPTAGSLDVLCNALAAIPAGKLALVAGDEVFTAQASGEVVALAELLASPVFVASWPRHIPFPTAHPLWAGTLPTLATDLRALFERFDAVLILGGHSAVTYLYSEGAALPTTCQLYQLSANAGDLGRTYATKLSCVDDLKASLTVLLPLLTRALVPPLGDIAGRLAAAASEQEASRAVLARRVHAEFNASAITPLVAAAEVVRAVGPGVTIVDEAAATFTHVRACLRSHSSRQYNFMRSAILGWGLPAAVGTSLGLGREPVVAIVGDGAALYAPQALWTAAHEKLPVTFVVMNNAEYNILKRYMHSQAHYLSARANRFPGMDLAAPNIDFVALASSFGLPARRIERAIDIAEAIEASINSGSPSLIEIVISATQ